MTNASDHRGLWTEPRYPGDIVRQVLLYRGSHGRPLELGDIRIQRDVDLVRVGSFLPGVEEGYPGDTIRVWPEKSHSFRADNQTDLADGVFDTYLQEAYAAGWQNYYPEQHGALRWHT